MTSSPPSRTRLALVSTSRGIEADRFSLLSVAQEASFVMGHEEAHEFRDLGHQKRQSSDLGNRDCVAGWRSHAASRRVGGGDREGIDVTCRQARDGARQCRRGARLATAWIARHRGVRCGSRHITVGPRQCASTGAGVGGRRGGGVRARRGGASTARQCASTGAGIGRRRGGRSGGRRGRRAGRS